MPALRELQQCFSRQLFGSQPAADGAGMYCAGLLVYRNNLYAGLTAALRRAYPVLARLVGEACFRAMARDYIRRYPPADGAQRSFGKHYAEFLAGLGTTREYPYLADVARLEWACQQALIAPDADASNLARLAELDEDCYQQLRLRVDPSVALVESPYPIHLIWDAHQRGDDDIEPIDLARGEERVLVWRHTDNVMVRPLEPAEFRFTAALARGELLAGTIADNCRIAPDFAVADTLQWLVRAGVVTGFDVEVISC